MFVVKTFSRYLIRCSQYVRHGYHFYVLGEVPIEKDPTRVDAKLIDRYQITRCRMTRTHRRRAGEGNVVYLRLGHRFILMASEGRHHFFEAENPHDCRVRPILISGYSIGLRGNTPSIELAPHRFRAITREANKLALHNLAKVTAFFASLSPLHFKGVIQQQKKLLGSINNRRRRAGLPLVKVEEIWREKEMRRRKRTKKKTPTG